MSRARAFGLMMASPANNPVARLPDNFVGATSIIKLKYTTTLTGDVSGNLAYAIAPRLDQFQYAGATTDNATKVITWGTATEHPENTAFVAEAARMRFLASEVQLSYIGAEDASAGRLSIIKTEAGEGSWETNQTNHFNDLESHVISVHQIKAAHLSAVLTPYDRPYFDGSQSVNHADYMPALTIVGAGLPSTACLQVTVTTCLEFVAKPTSLLRHHQRQAPVDPDAMMDVQRKLKDVSYVGVQKNAEREEKVKQNKKRRRSHSSNKENRRVAKRSKTVKNKRATIRKK